MSTVSFIVTTFPFCYASVMKQNVNSVKFISEKDRVRMMNTFFKVKLQVLAIQFAALIKRTFTYAIFSRNFQNNCYLSFSEQQILKDYTSKRLHQRLEKHLWVIRKKTLHMLYRVSLLNKRLKRLENMPMTETLIQ